MIRHSIYALVAIFIATHAILGAAQHDKPVIVRNMTIGQLETEMTQEVERMNQEKWAWRHATTARVCRYYTGMICSCCVPCIAGGIKSVLVSESEFETANEAVDERGEPMCGLEVLPLVPVAAGFLVGIASAWGFDRWYSPNQTERQHRINALHDAWYKKLG